MRRAARRGGGRGAGHRCQRGAAPERLCCGGSTDHLQWSRSPRRLQKGSSPPALLLEALLLWERCPCSTGSRVLRACRARHRPHRVGQAYPRDAQDVGSGGFPTFSAHYLASFCLLHLCSSSLSSGWGWATSPLPVPRRPESTRLLLASALRRSAGGSGGVFGSSCIIKIAS